MASRAAALGALAATVSVAFGTLLYAFSVLVTESAAGSEFSTGLLSAAYGGTVLVGGGLAFVVGPAVDARGVRLAMGAGSLLGAAGMVGLATASHGWQVIAASWLLIGPAGALTFYEPAFIAVDQWFEPEERGKAIGVLTVIGGLAGPVFLPLTATLVEGLGWRPAALTLAAILAVVGVVAAGVVLPSGNRGGDRPQPEGVSVRHLFADPRFVLYTISVLLLFGAFQTVLFHRIALFEAAGFGIALVSFWAGVSGWLSFPGRYVGPVLGSGRNGVRWNAGVVALMALTLVPMLTPSGRGLMILHFVAFGVVFGAVLPMRAAVMATWFSGPAFGRVMGVQWTLAAVAGAAGPALAGLSRDVTGGYDLTITVAIAGLMVAAALTLLANRSAPLTGRS